MRRLAVALLAAVAATFALRAQAPMTPVSRSIRGQVVDALSDVALRRARVTVSFPGTPQTFIFADEEGRFVVDAPAPAELTIRAGKGGYTTEATVVPADVTTAELRLALTRSAAVEGSVRNGFGAPVRNAYVTARLLTADVARDRAAPTRFYKSTDDLGGYRLAGLPAGRYEITAVRIPSELPRSGSKVEDVLFGSRESLQMAGETQRVTLAAGDELQAEFTIEAALETCNPRPEPAERGSGTAVIQGRVTGPSGEPLACASVSLIRPSTMISRTQTDQQGRYAIETLPPGSYVVLASKGRYVALVHGQRHPDDREVPITIDARTKTVRVDFVLPRQPLITGAVVDDFGEPVEGISVQAWQLTWREGRVSAVTTQVLAAMTDDRGRYRALGLMPSTYHVATGTILSTGTGPSGRVYPRVFHPGSLSLPGSQQVTVDAGRDAHEINIQLVPAFAATVTGTALDATGRPLAGTVRLSPSARSGAVLGPSLTVPLDGEGRFVARGVTAGEYVASASHSSNGRRQFGVQFVTVADDDPAPVALRTSEGATITGKVLIDGVPASDEAGITVTAHPADPDLVPNDTPVSSSSPKSVLQNGTFRLADVMGPSRLLVYVPRCADCYVEWAFVNGADASQRSFDFRTNGGRHDDVEIEVSSAGATVEGRVRNNRAGLATSMVVVFPADRALWTAPSQHVKTASPSTADGAFRLVGLPPGAYFIAAAGASFTNRFGNAFEDPHELEQLMPRARPITLRERGRLTLDLDPLR